MPFCAYKPQTKHADSINSQMYSWTYRRVHEFVASFAIILLIHSDGNFKFLGHPKLRTLHCKKRRVVLVTSVSYIFCIITVESHCLFYLPNMIQNISWGELSEPHIYESAVNFFIYIYIFIYLIRRAVNHLQFLFCVYQLCLGHMHVLQDTYTLRTCPYIERSVYFSDQCLCWNCACYYAQLWSTVMPDSKSTPGSSWSKEERLWHRGEWERASHPILSWVRSDRLRIYMHIQLAHTRPPKALHSPSKFHGS